ncbi:MAG: TonB-dependent receptor [Ignavibacteriales bacterium]|nr:TonB-dependent receptor [Ignavibacteriales bacterium]
MYYRKLFFALLFLPFLLPAQTDTLKTTLNEVVVTATKTETPYYTLASSVSILSSKDILSKQYSTVVDLLRGIPGLSIVQQGGPGKIANVMMRGANSNHTLVILDGTELNDASSPNNAFDFYGLDAYDIDRIEIVRGPQSTLYGSDAVAGVINILTKNGTSIPSYSFTGEGGSNGFYRANLSASGKYSLADYYFSLIRNGSGGVSASSSKYGNTEKDGFVNNGATAKIGFDFSEFGKLKLIYKFTKLDSDIDQNEKFGDDPNFTYKTEEQIFNASYTLNSFNGAWEKIFRGSVIKKLARGLDEFDALHPATFSDSYNKAQRVKFDWQNNLKVVENNLVTVGIETEKEIANTSYYSESMWGPYESVFPEQSVRTTSIYLQDQINIASSFFASAGIRYDDNEKFGSVTTYRIAPAYYFSATGTKIKFTYGTGYKAPSLYYIFDPLYGNPDLKPEESKGWDFGFDQYLFNGKISLNAAYFNIQLENMFGFGADYRTINIAEASSKGFEFSAASEVFDGLAISTNYTFTETKDEYSASADYGKPLIRRPKHQASIFVNYNYENRLNLNTQLRYTGERDDKEFYNYSVRRVTLPDYLLVNVSGSYKLMDYLTLTARIENLFDKDYEEVLFYGTLGRSFYAGVNINL